MREIKTVLQPSLLSCIVSVRAGNTMPPHVLIAAHMQQLLHCCSCSFIEHTDLCLSFHAYTWTSLIALGIKSPKKKKEQKEQSTMKQTIFGLTHAVSSFIDIFGPVQILN